MALRLIDYSPSTDVGTLQGNDTDCRQPSKDGVSSLEGNDGVSSLEGSDSERARGAESSEAVYARVRRELTARVLDACLGQLSYASEMRVEGLLAVTLDKHSVLVVNIAEVN